ncbi:hypothetical protein T4A_68 [Trichinella pseudospiralis]|uniref:Uncharacterized protein n=1 Tax=Trichinella pseudospiralis TaxID=6337 RepID=A0A0V1EZD3_TRIPS|nr:hypothetical protein T4A_68 [Trichinella pseudospiralis]
MRIEHFLMTKASVLITHTIPLLACSIILIHYLALNKERRSAESTNENALSRIDSLTCNFIGYHLHIGHYSFDYDKAFWYNVIYLAQACKQDKEEEEEDN